MKIIFGLCLIMFFLSCNSVLNSYVEESDKTFNPELTALYNQIIKRPNSEKRILGITHYSLTAQTIEFLDSVKIEIQKLECKAGDENYVYTYLQKSQNGAMLKELLANSVSNDYAMCDDSSVSHSIDKYLNELKGIQQNNHWLDSTFARKGARESAERIEHYKTLINSASIIIMENLLIKSQ